MSNHKDTRDGFLIEGDSYPTIKATSSAVKEAVWGGDEVEVIPKGVIATGGREYTNLVAIIPLFDVRTQSYYGKNDKPICRSDDGHNPVSEEVLETVKPGPCRDELGNPVCRFLVEKNCGQGRKVFVVRLPLLEEMVKGNQLPTADDWENILANYSYALMNVSKGSLYKDHGYTKIKESVISIGDNLEVTPLVVIPEQVENGSMEYTKLLFFRLPEGHNPKPELVGFRDEVKDRVLPGQFAKLAPATV